MIRRSPAIPKLLRLKTNPKTDRGAKNFSYVLVTVSRFFFMLVMLCNNGHKKMRSVYVSQKKLHHNLTYHYVSDNLTKANAFRKYYEDKKKLTLEMLIRREKKPES